MRSRFELRLRPAAAAAAALLALAAGCDSLPDGEPPKGDLTDNAPTPVSTPLAVKNHLTTQLIVFALRNDVADLDPGDDAEVIAIAADAARTAGFKLVRGAELKLRLARRDGGMELAAVRDGVEVWRSQRP